jgi:hypothetical protein
MVDEEKIQDLPLRQVSISARGYIYLQSSAKPLMYICNPVQSLLGRGGSLASRKACGLVLVDEVTSLVGEQVHNLVTKEARRRAVEIAGLPGLQSHRPRGLLGGGEGSRQCSIYPPGLRTWAQGDDNLSSVLLAIPPRAR